MEPEPRTTYRFGAFALDQRLYELRAGEVRVKLEPKVFDVLAYLIRHRERVVSKDELLDALWPDESVSESVLPRCITAARKALGDDRARSRLIATVHGRGYRFVAPVREEATADTAPAAGDGSAPAVPRLFVGREQAMGELGAALAAALAGDGRLVLLVGEPGIGKTRTAEEIGAAAAARGARVLTGRCHEGEGAPAFWPWVQLLRGLVRATEPAALAAELGAGAADVAQLVPEIHERVPDVAGRPAVAPEQARFRLFDAVAGLLRRASESRPLVLLVDDLHWADKPSLLLVQFLAREMRAARLLVVGTYRDVELGRRHPLAELLGELARESLYHRIVLRGLAPADVARFVELSLGEPPDARLVAEITEMTEGNPFFVGEIVRLVTTAGRASGITGPLPQGVREAIGRRLSALSEECNAILAAASVIGRDFSLAALERATDATGEDLLSRLDEALAARIVTEVEGRTGQFRFAHALVRETLYEELPTVRRVRLHRRIGAVLEEIHGAGAGPALARIAHHFFQAAAGGDVERAVGSGMRAAEHAWQLLAYEEAAGYYERVLEVLELQSPVDEARRSAVLLRLGEARLRAGEREDARRSFRRAAEIARALRRPDQLALAALGFGGRAEFGVFGDTELLALLEEALGALGDGHDALRARVLSRLVGTPPHSDSMEARAALSREAVALARAVGDPATLAEALNAEIWALNGPDHPAARYARGDELLRLATAHGERNWAFLARTARYDVLLERGDMDAADRELATLAALADELHQPIEQWFVAWFRAGRALADGRFDEAERLIERGRAIGRRAQHPSAEAAFSGQLLWLQGERGLMIERARVDDFRASFDFIRRTVPSNEQILRTGLANVYESAGLEEEARHEYEAVVAADFTDLARNEHWLVTLGLLTELCVRFGDVARAARLYELQLPFADRNAVHNLIRTSRGSVHFALGRLAATCGREREAVAHLEEALAMNARMGFRPSVARVQCEYAALLFARDRRGERDRAIALVADAEATARALGMRSVVERAREVAALASAPRRSPPGAARTRRGRRPGRA